VLNKQITLPIWAVVMLISTCSYILSPIDLIPDLLPFGFLDDIALAIWTFEQTKSFFKKEEF